MILKVIPEVIDTPNYSDIRSCPVEGIHPKSFLVALVVDDVHFTMVQFSQINILNIVFWPGGHNTSFKNDMFWHLSYLSKIPTPYLINLLASFGFIVG